MFPTKNKPGSDLNNQSAIWGYAFTQIRFKLQNCNLGLCFDPCFRVFHTKSQFWETSQRKKQITQLQAPFFIMYRYFLNTNILFYITSVRGVDFMKGGQDKLTCPRHSA
jgi:hypothetical protein